MNLQTVLNTQNTERTFDFSKFICQYSNVNQMRISDYYAPTLQITNYLARKEGNALRKVTEIHLQDKVIIIQDRYQMESQEMNNDEQKTSSFKIQLNETPQIKQQEFDDIPSSKKKLIRKKMNKTLMPKKHKHTNSNNDKLLDIKRDTKNIPRNVLRVFSKYLEQKQPLKQKNLIQKIQKIGYNNTLVSEIISDESLVQIFKYFLQQPAKQWLMSSRIKDKESHLEAISIYLRMINSQETKIQSQSNQEKMRTNQVGEPVLEDLFECF